MKQYKIVLDSSGNLSPARWDAFGGTTPIASVPLKIHNERREYVDDENLDVSAMVQDFLTVKGKSGSACPNMGEWLDAFGDADEVFAFAISGNLSGSYAAAVQAGREYEELHPGRRVLVFDSLSTGPEMQLLAEKTEELICAGCTFEEISEELRAYHRRTHLIFSLESLRNLAANGRVNVAVAALAGVLGIRVIAKASEEGTIEMLHKARGEKQALRTLLQTMRENGFAGGKVRIAHCLNETAAHALAELIGAGCKHADVRVIPCGGLCSFYAEKGGLLIGFESVEAT